MAEKRKKAAKAAKLHKDKMACNKPRKTPSHPTKSHVVKACQGRERKNNSIRSTGRKGGWEKSPFSQRQSKEKVILCEAQCPGFKSK